MVRWHYCSARQQALSFLLTIGAKALVMTEAVDLQPTSNKLAGINEEAQMRKVIVSQERVRSLRRNIVEKVPLRVWKQARNGEIRPIEVVVKSEGRKHTFLEWRSKLNYQKRFEVEEETIINCRLDQRSLPPDSCLARFKNSRRFLDLQFKQKTELDAFILVLQSYVPSVIVIL